MKVLRTKVLLPIFCALAMLVSVFGMVTAAGMEARSESQKAMPWRDEPTELDKILERDGYLEGIMFPWFSGSLGHSLTSNELLAEYSGSVNTWGTTGLEQYGAIKIYREIYNLKVMGYNIMGYEGSPYGEGVVYDKNGDVLGIKEDYLNNVRTFLQICREVGMPIAWTVTFHSTTLNEYYPWGKNAWDIISQAYANPVVADHYAERFVEPLCDVLNEYKDVVVLMVSSVELENEINDSAIGNHFSQRELYGTTQENMLYFIDKVTDTVKEKMPNVPRTLAANTKDMTIYEGIDFDMLGVNNYNINANVPSVDNMKATVPMLGTEFGFGDHAVLEDEVWTIRQVRFRQNYIEAGYKGWFYWCWSTSGGKIYDLLKQDNLSTTDFRAGAYAIKYNADNYRAAHRGEELTLTAPVLFCNTGSGTVEWVASPQGAYVTLERSTDGGKTWVTLLDQVENTTCEKDFKGHYVDEEIANCTTGGKVCYRVTAIDDWGDMAVSEPNNEAEILGPAINALEGLNCDFELGDLTNWKDWGENAAKDPNGKCQFYADVVKLEDGNHVLEFKDLGDGKDWWGVCNGGITVKPNTNYTLTLNYKLAKNVTYMTGYVFIRGYNPGAKDGPGNKLGDIQDATLISGYMNEGKNSQEWYTQTLNFKTNDSDKLGIDFRTSDTDDCHYYFDNICLYEVR